MLCFTSRGTCSARQHRHPVTTNEVIISGILNVVIAARDRAVKRIVFASSSSSSVYGNDPRQPEHEDMGPRPMSHTRFLN
ncbi:NAD-dependent epimerase/dehydratase family protein [candidate division KSB1 bacterium]|nr:NAD-dependent epimerase/dehydratase family protein [candidate division KSB1 bacterium]